MRSQRVVRWLGAGVLAALLAGCAGKMTEPEEGRAAQPLAGSSVTPRPLEVTPLAGYAPEQQLALALISHYLGAPLYRMSNPLPMSQEYQLAGALHSPNEQQVMVMMQHQDQTRWALVSLGRSPRRGDERL